MDELLTRARNGDLTALEDVLRDIAPAVRRFGLRMCRSDHDADDVLQDTLLNIATHLKDFEGRSSFSSWVFALARSACARRRRGLKNRPPVDSAKAPEPPTDDASPEERAESQQTIAAVTEALDALPDDYREVIALRDIEGLSAADAAVALGISVDALKSRLHRARAALREALTPVFAPEGLPAPGPNCPDLLAMWSMKLEGDLSASDCQAMEGHIKQCRSCGPRCDALKQALWACQRSASEPVRPEIQEQVRAAVKAIAVDRTRPLG